MSNQKMQVQTVDSETGEITTHVVTHRRPPRWVFWKHEVAMMTFRRKIDEIAEGNPDATPEEKGAMAQVAFSMMSDMENAAYQAAMDEIVKHSHHPQLPVDDLTEESYGRLLARTMYATGVIPVQTKDGETDAATVEKFPEKPGVSDAGAPLSDVREKPGRGDGPARSATKRRHRQPRKRVAATARP